MIKHFFRYLDATLGHGNIVRGWEGYIDSKPRINAQSKRDKKIKPSERIFSYSSYTSPIPNDDIEREDRQRNTPSPTLKRTANLSDTGEGTEKKGRSQRKKKRKRKMGDSDFRG